ncbi:MAG: DUF2905 domain-containing protein [Bdellovibrionales bacterium]|nr:DUF2905 domain-containing protein [Bdellovibrionales bacterium]
MQSIAKLLIILGLALVCAGIAWHFGWIQSLKLGKLPGDFYFKAGGTTVFFPLTTCVLISLLVWIISWILKR